MATFQEDLIRLLAALAAGGLIGIEREIHDKPAGFRTNILICIGAALFTILSLRIAGGSSESTRIAAQIVTGVGFLGAGAILHARGQVIGLTTAATIWTVASLGMTFGAGYFALGAAATVVVHGVLVLLVHIESYVAKRRTEAHIEIELEPGSGTSSAMRESIVAAGLTCKNWSLTKLSGSVVIRALVEGPQEQIDHLQTLLAEDARVRTVSRV